MEVQQILGVLYLTLDGNNKTQCQILLDKTQTWAGNAHTAGHHNRVAAWLNLITTILQQVHYVLLATTLS